MSYVKISKNMKDRTDRLFEAIEHPDRFSDDEIQEMLNDPCMQELYKQICKTADALTTTEEPDIDREWEQSLRIYCIPSGYSLTAMRQQC